MHNKPCSFHMTVNGTGSTTDIFHKCHILLKLATLGQVTDNNKKDSYHPEESNAHTHLLNLPTSTAVSRVKIRLICSKFTFQVPSLMVQHDILPVKHLIADLTCKLLIPVLFLVFWKVAVCREESETHLTLERLVICKQEKPCSSLQLKRGFVCLWDRWFFCWIWVLTCNPSLCSKGSYLDDSGLNIIVGP